MSARCEIEITKDGMFWPFVWRWKLVYHGEGWPSPGARWARRSGEALTKDRARRRALAVKRQIEEDEVYVIHE